MSSLKVGIQGIKASFHDVASRQYFSGKNIEIVECATFENLSKLLDTGQLDFGVMAIENSLAGSLLPNYILLEKYHLKILGETYLRIALHLMALKGKTINDVKFVISHPIALAQSTPFLLEHPHIKILEAQDTAESAKIIADEHREDYGAIASRSAAEAYGLNILASEIETHYKNYTRFLIVGKEKLLDNQANKATIRFEHEHRPGSLAEILTLFAKHQINLSKIQSVPILGKPYQYGFHVDLEWDNREDYDTGMKAVKNHVINLINFGEYPKGDKPV